MLYICWNGQADKRCFRVLKLHVEFDETQQEQGVNFGLVRNKASFPVLVPHHEWSKHVNPTFLCFFFEMGQPGTKTHRCLLWSCRNSATGQRFLNYVNGWMTQLWKMGFRSSYSCSLVIVFRLSHNLSRSHSHSHSGLFLVFAMRQHQSHISWLTFRVCRFNWFLTCNYT